MRHCLKYKSPSSSSAATTTTSTVLPGNSREDTPRSNISQLSPATTTTTSTSTTVNLSREYTLAVQTNSYNEIWSRIHVTGNEDEEENEGRNPPLLLSQVLQPNRECVQEALRYALLSTLTNIVSSYFDHSENTCRLCLLLYHSIDHARAHYAPLLELLDNFPLESEFLNQSNCDWAFDVFLQFDRLDNPFPSPESHNFQEMRSCFSQLKQQLDRRLRKSRSRINHLRRATAGGAICLIGATVAVAASAVVIAAHSFVTLVGAAFLTISSCLPANFNKKELAHISQLDAAAKGTYVLNNDLDTIDRLVARLHTAVESDKLLIRLGLERGRDRHPIQEVVKQLRKNHSNFLNQLKDLEEHICLCFATVNRARSLLLQEICLHQTFNS